MFKTYLEDQVLKTSWFVPTHPQNTFEKQKKKATQNSTEDLGQEYWPHSKLNQMLAM